MLPPQSIPSNSFSGCGIAGAISLGLDSEESSEFQSIAIEAMAESLRHRGPDDGNQWRAQGVCLAHRRLSILDLTQRGRQPMTREHLSITHNGEVYNFQELRSQLEDEGYEFESDTDTEVILRAYQAWGTACLDRFNGMFAFAIWNHQKRELFVARDRVGIKPLYWFQSRQAFLFASEVKALLASSIVPKETNTDALFAQLIARSYYAPDQSQTLIKNVYLLRPGHYLRIHANGETTERAYWSLPDSTHPSEAATIEQSLEKFVDLFRSSIKYRLISDVPVGTFLSGGMDSSLINAFAVQEAIQPPLHAFTIRNARFTSAESPITEENEDTRYSERVKAHLGNSLAHQIISVEPSEISIDRIDSFFDYAWLPDDNRFPALYRNYQTIHEQGLKIVLNGQGPDETMGGYIGENPFASLGLQAGDHRQALQTILPNLSMIDLEKQSPELQQARQQVFAQLTNSFLETSAPTPLHKAHHYLARTLMHRTLLFEDFMSMKFGVECRVPFLDHRIVEFAFQTPFEWHIDSTEKMGKQFLRMAGSQVLPEDICQRRKQPFPHPERKALFRTLLAIYQTAYTSIRSSPLVHRIYAAEWITPKAERLAPRDIWIVIILWRWETLLRNA